jgi:large subunit ribosomal protein L2
MNLKKFKNNFIWSSRPLKKLSVVYSNPKPGRTKGGFISVYNRSSRKFKLISRLINNKFSLLKNEFCQVLRLERDPKRTAFLALVRFLKSGFLGYFAVPSTVSVGSMISLNPIKFNARFFNNFLKINTVSLPLYKIPRGSLICNIERNPFCGAKLCRAAGTKAKLQSVSFKLGLASVLLPSGNSIFLSVNSYAFLGLMSNSKNILRLKYKAGQNINLGFRPNVRGVAMNPVDHPHGGGEGRTSGGRPSVSPWGFLTKGFSTTSLKKKRLRFKVIKQYRRTSIKKF